MCIKHETELKKKLQKSNNNNKTANGIKRKRISATCNNEKNTFFDIFDYCVVVAMKFILWCILYTQYTYIVVSYACE